jgi:hypothetical protein
LNSQQTNTNNVALTDQMHSTRPAQPGRAISLPTGPPAGKNAPKPNPKKLLFENTSLGTAGRREVEAQKAKNSPVAKLKMPGRGGATKQGGRGRGGSGNRGKGSSKGGGKGGGKGGSKGRGKGAFNSRDNRPKAERNGRNSLAKGQQIAGNNNRNSNNRHQNPSTNQMGGGAASYSRHGNQQNNQNKAFEAYLPFEEVAGQLKRGLLLKVARG